MAKEVSMRAEVRARLRMAAPSYISGLDSRSSVLLSGIANTWHPRIASRRSLVCRAGQCSEPECDRCCSSSTVPSPGRPSLLNSVRTGRLSSHPAGPG